jgi:hypothetical protein
MATNELVVVGVGSDGMLWATIRNANTSWQSSFGLVESQSSGGPPAFIDVADGTVDGLALQIVGVGSDGKLWHTVRNGNGTWQVGFGRIEDVSSGGPPTFKCVGCAGTSGLNGLQVVGVGNDGRLWHTIRYNNGSWVPSFGLIETQSTGGAPAYTDVDAGSVDGQALQVVGVGSDGKLWHTLRNSNGSWVPSFGLIETQSTGGPPSFKSVACAGTSGSNQLHVVGVGSDGKLWHTLRNANGSWASAFGLIEVQSSGGPPTFVDVSCGSADGLALQVAGVGSDGKLWHTIRNADSTWQSGFGLVETQSSGGPLSFKSGVGCAGAVAAYKQLGLVEQPQQQTEWCWLATTVSITRFYNAAYAGTQCLLANQMLGQAGCCADGSTAACNQPGFPDQALTQTGHLAAAVMNKPTLLTLMNEIDAGHPVSVNIQWNGGGGHNPAVDGYDNSDPAAPTVDVQDPWYGPSTQDFNTFPGNYNGGGVWWESYFTH